MNGRIAASLAFAATIGVACALRDPRVGGAGLPCDSSSQCSSDSVCFLGECRGSSSELALVEAEVRAPASEQLGTLQRSAIDLRVSTVVDFQLRPLLTASGTVIHRLNDGGVASVPDAGVVLTIASPSIVDRVPSVATQTDDTGAFSISFADSTWHVLVVPPLPEPPARQAPPVSPLASSTSVLQPVIPARRELTNVALTLLIGGSPLAGARVAAVDGKGSALSVPAITDAQGTFALELPPPPIEYFLQVGPDPTAPSTSAAVPTFPARGPFSSPSPGSTCPAPLVGDCLDLGALPAPATLSGKVLDVRQQPLAAVPVLAVSTDPTGWVLSRQAVTDSTGAYTLSLRAGVYSVEAVPPADPASPGLSGESLTPVQMGSQLTLVCPDKSQAAGVVLGPDGKRVGAGYQVTATHFPDRLVTGRIASATATDGTGTFTIVGDAGQYRVEIVPPSSSGFPRKIAALTLPPFGSSTPLPAVQLSPSLAVVGTVTATRSTTVPVAGVTVDFFALDSTRARSVLIGSGLTDSLGHYRAVLPDVALPADHVALR
jgi:hypothetical protein